MGNANFHYFEHFCDREICEFAASTVTAELHQPHRQNLPETTVFLLSSKLCGPNPPGKIEMRHDDSSIPVFQAVFRSQNLQVSSFRACGELDLPRTERDVSRVPQPAQTKLQASNFATKIGRVAASTAKNSESSVFES